MLVLTNLSMSFHKLGLDEKLVDEIHQMGFEHPTPIQESCIPLILDGKDIIGQSLTGSGKTAAFGLPLLHKVSFGQGVQALILTPTRELTHQVKEHLETIGKKMKLNIVCVYGGVGIDRQIRSLRSAEIVVATPGRLLDHMQRGTIDLRKIKYLVLDEADRMLDMGFQKDIERILSKTPKDRQTILFSATFPPLARKIAQRYLINPEHIKEQEHVDAGLLSHKFFQIGREGKFSLLVHLLNKARGTSLVFCRTKREVDKIAKNLRKQRFEALAIHGDIPQNKRLRAVEAFREGQVDVLVATDVAARGIDIKGISHVYNYDVPDDAEDYTHRVGRTARAGKKGEAITILTKRDEEKFWHISQKIEILEERLPDFEQVQLIAREHYSGRGPPRNFNRSPKNAFSNQRKRPSKGGRRASGPRRKRAPTENSEGEFRSKVKSFKRSSSRDDSSRDSSRSTPSRGHWSDSARTVSKPSSSRRGPSRGGFSKTRSPRGSSSSTGPSRGSSSRGGFSKPRSGGSNSQRASSPKDRSSKPRAPRSSSRSGSQKPKKKFYKSRN
jgi:ATP-dependent RNA helicase DeaD